MTFSNSSPCFPRNLECLLSKSKTCTPKPHLKLNMGQVLSKGKKQKGQQFFPPPQQVFDQMGGAGWQTNSKVNGQKIKNHGQSQVNPPHVQQLLNKMAQPGWPLN